MNRLPPSWLVLALASGLLLVAAGYLLYPGTPMPQPLAVEHNDQEIAWLYPATAHANWNRFITALGRTEDDLAATFPGIRVKIEARTFPVETIAIPEAALEWPDGKRLVFRWYKTTSEQDVGHWLRALVGRNPAPLAILGGSTSDAAYRVLASLRELTPPRNRPLMLLTTGTADRWIASPDERTGRTEDILDMVPGRTFRFCFSNEQMARATCDFIWNQPDLRPDSDPAYLIHWLDDAYSRDLIEGYLGALQGIAIRAALDDHAWVLGSLALPGALPSLGGPIPIHRLGLEGSNFRLAVPHSRQLIDSSVGTFSLPNRFELEVSKYLLLDLAAHPKQRRPLVAVTGQALPCRRFLRAIMRSDPVRGRQFVVTSGDAISFTTLFRDRLTHWPIQDLPFPLVAFAHQNPIDEDAGFSMTSQTGTDDLLLLDEILLAIGLTYHEGEPARDPDTLARRLQRLHYANGRIVRSGEGRTFFDARGNRASGTGEHLLCLRPKLAGERVLPEASLEVFRWAVSDAGRTWRPIGKPLQLLYDQADSNPGSNE